MEPKPVTPRSLILDMLRVSPRQRAVSISDLVALGALFGFSDNAVRVAVTRLASKGLLVSQERGSYRLAPRTDPLNQWVDEWRSGERRMRRWKGRWLAIWHPPGASRSDRSRSHRAMRVLGFRPGLDGLWVRPDNLTRRRGALHERLRGLGLLDGAELIAADGFSPAVTARWTGQLWDTAELLHEQRRALGAIEASTRRARRAAPSQMLVETFLVGGAAIRALALDPLLPEVISPAEPRRQLTEAMLAYDQLGRSTWGNLLGEAPAVAPTNRSVSGGTSHA